LTNGLMLTMVKRIAQKIREEFRFDANVESMVHAEERLLLVTYHLNLLQYPGLDESSGYDF